MACIVTTLPAVKIDNLHFTLWGSHAGCIYIHTEGFHYYRTDVSQKEVSWAGIITPFEWTVGNSPYGLDSGYTYYFRAFIVYSHYGDYQWFYGDWLEFYTGSSIPTVTTQAVTDILSTTATGNGNITDLGGENATKRGICYNLTGSPTVADSKVEETGSFETGAFTENLINLSPGTTYHVKAYAYNSAGYGYGTEADFTTDKIAPTVTTKDNACKDRQSTTLTATGNITATGGGVTYRGFEYYEHGAGDEYDSSMWAVREIGTFNSTGEFEMTLTGLKPSTTYYIRAFAGNTIGIAYGEWVQCSTTEVPSYDIYEVANTATYKLYVSDDEAIAWRGYKGPYTAKQQNINITDITNKTKGVKVLKLVPTAKGNFHVCITVKQELKN